MGGIIKELKSQLTCAAHLPGELGFFLSAIKNKKMNNKQNSLEDIFQLNEELKSTYIRELHKHIQELYDENDSQRKTIQECYEKIEDKATRIRSILDTNEKLAAQVLNLKAQLHDLLK